MSEKSENLGHIPYNFESGYKEKEIETQLEKGRSENIDEWRHLQMKDCHEAFTILLRFLKGPKLPKKKKKFSFIICETER